MFVFNSRSHDFVAQIASLSAVIFFPSLLNHNLVMLQVSVWIPVFFIVVCLFLVFLPVYYKPLEVAVAIAITLTGIPAYFIGVSWNNKPQWFHRGHGRSL